MNDFPSAPANYAQERIGIAAVQTFAAVNGGQIWRETTTGDVGIDGHLEHVDASGKATGRTIAVQVKCGPSYFGSSTPTGWKYTPAEKHRTYWERYPLPVVLVLHDPSGNRSYWADVRQILRTPGTEASSYFEIPKANVLQETTVDRLFANAGVQGEVFIHDLKDVLAALVKANPKDRSLPVSYFDLYTQGLTNLCRSLYFSMDLVMKAAEWNNAAEDGKFGIGVGHAEYEFLLGYIKFLVAQHLADVDFSDCLIDWDERELVPSFMAALTARGRGLVRLIHEREEALVKSGRLANEGSLHVAQEGFVEIVERSYVKRLPRIRAFQALVLEDLKQLVEGNHRRDNER